MNAHDAVRAKRKKFRELLTGPRCTVMPGGFSPLYAKMAERAGFESFFFAGSQMSAFLLKTEHGSAFVPPACSGVFGDVPCPSTFADWIEQLSAEMITGGCGGGNYCPQNANTRGQMAVFLTKTFHLQ